MVRRLSRRLNVVELYAGTARSADAFRAWKKVRIGLLVDRDQLAYETYFQNYADAPYHVGNVARLTHAEIECMSSGKVDILLGCPPCQGFSDSGLRDPRDPRNAHLTRFARLAERLRPLAVAMENVPLAGSARRFACFARRMQALGYRSTWGVLNSALRGSAQCRHRLIYIGLRRDVGVDPVIPSPSHGGVGLYYSYRLGRQIRVSEDRVSLLGESPGVRRVRTDLPYREDLDPLGRRPIPTVGEAWSGLPALATEAASRLDHTNWAHTAKVRRRMGRIPEGGRWSGGADHFAHAYGRLHRKGLSPTVTTFFSNPGSGRYWHPADDRAISLREAARLQGFPDTFKFLTGQSSCRLVGNALDACLADVTYQVIRSSLE